MHTQTPTTGALVCTDQNILNVHSSASPSGQISRNLEGDIVNPFPLWRHTTRSIASFDGGTRFSATLKPANGFCHFRHRFLEALREHIRTRQPVQLLSGVDIRGASGKECEYFRERPERGAFVLVTDEFRVIVRAELLQTRLQASADVSKNTAVVILGWRAFLQEKSVSAAYRRVCDFLSAFGLTTSLEVINRVDVNVTTDDLPMDVVRDAYTSKLFWTRSAGDLKDKRVSVLGTLYIGLSSSPVLLRVYDKTAELRANMGTDEGRAKLRYFREQFGEDSLTHLTRVEFELHRTFLRDFHVSDFDELESKLSAMLKYLTGKWLRVLAVPRNAKSTDRHRERVKLAPWWVKLSANFADFAQTLTENPRDVSRAKHVWVNGSRSKARSLAWLKRAGQECLSLQGEDLDEQGIQSKIDELAAWLAVALKLTPKAANPEQWGRGAELAWNYTLGNLED